MATIQTAIELQDNFTGVLYQVVNAVNMGVAAMSDLQHGMSASMDTASFEAMQDSAARAAASLDLYSEARQRAQASGAVPAWQTDSAPVFTSSGAERFAQEVEDVNARMGALYRTQTQIAAAASRAELFPPEASADITTIQERLGALQRRMAAIESDPLNMGTDAASAQLEHMRGLLGQALDAQEALNSAVGAMDVGAANRAYLQMSQSIGNAERYIRDNTAEQENFTRAVERSSGSADRLFSTVRGLVGAYVSLQSIGKVLEVSGSLSQTTARLDLMNRSMESAGKGAAGSTQEMLSMVYNAAQNARGSFSDMAEVVAKFGNNAGDAFSGSDEVVAFAELVQKQMKIAGASTMESANAMLQLSQALGSGVLRGDELNSIFEQAPNLIQNIADYLDVPLGSIREMASEGQLTADIVKAAMFDAAEDINERFNNMPMTWGAIWTSFQNDALMAFQPVLQRVNELAGSEAVQQFTRGAEASLMGLAGFALDVVNGMAAGADFVATHWDVIGPVVLGVAAALGVYAAGAAAVKIADAASAGAKIVLCLASYAHAAATRTEASAAAQATAAQYGLNTALLACPITWIVVGVIALVAAITAIVRALNIFGAKNTSVFGTLVGLANVAVQAVVNLGLWVANVALGIWNALGACCTNIGTAFHNTISNIQGWFYDLLATGLETVAGICEALNRLPFIEFDYSGISGKAAEYAAKSAAAYDRKEDYADIGQAFDKGFHTFNAFGDGWAQKAFQAGASWVDKLSPKDPEDEREQVLYATDPYTALGDSVNNIAGNTGKIANSLEVSQEDLKYMRDIAERDTINRYTTAEIKIEQTNHNNIASDMDLDGIVDNLTSLMGEAVAVSAKGAHA